MNTNRFLKLALIGLLILFGSYVTWMSWVKPGSVTDIATNTVTATLTETPTATATSTPTATPTPVCTFPVEVFPPHSEEYIQVIGDPQVFTAIRVVPGWDPSCGDYKFRLAKDQPWIYSADLAKEEQENWYHQNDPLWASYDHEVEIVAKNGLHIWLYVPAWIRFAIPTSTSPAPTSTPGW